MSKTHFSHLRLSCNMPWDSPHFWNYFCASSLFLVKAFALINNSVSSFILTSLTNYLYHVTLCFQLVIFTIKIFNFLTKYFFPLLFSCYFCFSTTVKITNYSKLLHYFWHEHEINRISWFGIVEVCRFNWFGHHVIYTSFFDTQILICLVVAY